MPEGATMAQLAIRWILMHEAVSTVIPGAKRPSQAVENARASSLAPFEADTMDTIADVYRQYARPQVHHRW